MKPLRRKRVWLLALSIIGVLTVGKGYWNATRDPLVRTATLSVDGPARAADRRRCR